MKQLAIVFYATILVGILPTVPAAAESAPPPVDRCSTPIPDFSPSDGSVFFLNNVNPELLSNRKIEKAVDDYWDNCGSYGSGSPSVLFGGLPPAGAVEIDVETIEGQRLDEISNQPLSPGYFEPTTRVDASGVRTMTGGTITLWTRDEQNRLNALHDTLAHELGHAYGEGHPAHADAGLCTGRIMGARRELGGMPGDRTVLRFDCNRADRHWKTGPDDDFPAHELPGPIDPLEEYLQLCTRAPLCQGENPFPWHRGFLSVICGAFTHDTDDGAYVDVFCTESFVHVPIPEPEPVPDLLIGAGPFVQWTTPTEGATVSGTIEVRGTAADPEGGVRQVLFWLDNHPIDLDAFVYGLAAAGSCAHPWGGSDPGCPHIGFAGDLDTTQLSDGEHTLQFLAIDNRPAFPMFTVVERTLMVVNTQSPFGGTPRPIPGRLQAEHYDDGPAELAYHDSTPGNAGGRLRGGDVDIGYSGQALSHYVGWIGGGEWIELTVDVAASGLYDLDLRLASAIGGGAVRIEMNGHSVATRSNLPRTGGWTDWRTVTIEDVWLGAGEQVMRVAMTQGGWNLDYLEFRSVAPQAAPDLEVSSAGEVVGQGSTISLPWSVAGEAIEHSLVLTNRGDDPLVIDSATVSGPCFERTTAPAGVVPAQGSTTLGLRFECAASSTGTVTIRSNDPDEDPYQLTVAGRVALRQTISANADAFITQEQPSRNFGAWSQLRLRHTATGFGRHAFVRFQVPQTGQVVSARLRIKTRSNAVPAVSFYRMNNMSWQESTINWSNFLPGGPQPFTFLRSLENLAAETSYTVDVSAAVNGPGTLTLGMATGHNQGGLDFYSRESSHPPVLEIIYQP